jgi:hypothetical protein
MECWRGLSYESIMRMPSSLRVRMILKKSDLEKERQRREERANRRR